MANTEILVVGHICLDIIPTLYGESVQFTPGRLIEAGPAVIATGGAVSNTGLALHRLGVATELVGKIGADFFGKAILEIVESQEPGLSQGMLIAPGETSSYTIILSPTGADRMFFHAPGCNATFAANDLPYERLSDVRMMHFGYPPLMSRFYQDNGSELTELFRRAKATGVTTSLDMSMPDSEGPAGAADWRAILQATLPYVDLFLPSIEELVLMLRPEEYERLVSISSDGAIVDLIPSSLVTELGQELIEMGASIVGIKIGHRGLYLRTSSVGTLAQIGRAVPSRLDLWANHELWASCYTAHVVGTTGSGDATIAGFLMAFLRDETPEQTLRAACAVGACSVEAADALSGVQSWAKTEERLSAGWPQLRLDFDSPDWTWNAHTKIWFGPLDSLGQ